MKTLQLNHFHQCAPYFCVSEFFGSDFFFLYFEQQAAPEPPFLTRNESGVCGFADRVEPARDAIKFGLQSG